jgi:hypothetical protein
LFRSLAEAGATATAARATPQSSLAMVFIVFLLMPRASHGALHMNRVVDAGD